MSFLYPRSISVLRPTAQAGVGALGYGGLTASAESTVLYKFSASIQLQQERGKPEAGLPSDPVGALTGWNIFIRGAKLGQIKDNDIIVDDLGERYQVVGNYWNSLGYKLSCNKLKT